MDVEFRDGKAIIKNIKNFEPQHIFDNGQAFRFFPAADGAYEGVAHGRFLRVWKEGESAVLYPCTEDEFYEIWFHYFDLGLEYARLFQDASDKELERAQQFGHGLRVLNQQPFETLISFIISANNNVRRIRGIVEKLCRTCGQAFVFEGETHYAFPEPKALAECNAGVLEGCGAGYRAPYIAKTARAVLTGFDLEALKMLDYSLAKNMLMSLAGVGPKVADCVLLFSLGKKDAFPADVWIKRVMEKRYGFVGTNKQIYAYAHRTFGKYAGIAQQYLFYYARENAGIFEEK